jgi:hypothetical protein
MNPDLSHKEMIELGPYFFLCLLDGMLEPSTFQLGR